MGLRVNQLFQVPIEEQDLEIVERKGVGHPDHICDAIMNEVSVALSKEYLKRYGHVMHHNIDKALLAAGEVKTRFGGGEVKRPMLMVFGDRATYDVDGDPFPVDELAVNTAKKWLKTHLRFVDPEKHVRYQVELKKGSQALTDIFKRKGKYYGANDTSAAVGYAPLTITERMVLQTEHYINSPSFKKEFPETGEAGKNPVSHVGKIYNLLTYEIANHVYQKVPGIKEVYVWLLSQIGRPINEPKVAGIELILDRGGDFKSASKQATEIIKSELNGINDFTKRLTEGKVSVC